MSIAASPGVVVLRMKVDAHRASRIELAESIDFAMLPPA
jgi:hypothetical protein